MSDHIDLEVQAINRKLRIALLSDGQEIPITSGANEDGVCDVDDANVCVCGPCFDGKWYVVNLREYEAATQN